MRERVSGTVHSLAFSLDGTRLWCAHATGIAIRAWPSLELMNLNPLVTQRLMATVNGTFLCATTQGVLELDEDGVIQRRLGVTGVVGLGLDDHDAVIVVRADTTRSPSHLHVERHTDDTVSVLAAGIGGGMWWCALLPTKKALILAMDDRPPHHVDFATGEHRKAWDWLPGWAEREVEFGGASRSWLSVDAAPDERCFVASDKGQNSTVVWLDDIGRMRGYIVLEHPRAGETPFIGSGWMKGPARGGAATVHPKEDVVALIDISGRMRVNDARTGKILDVIEDTFSGNYRWYGVPR